MQAKRAFVAPVVLVVLISASSNGQPPEFAVARIDEQLGITSLSWSTAINENGDAVGYALEPSGYRPFVYTYEQGAVYLPFVGAHPEATAVDLSDRDAIGEIVIVGTAGDANLEPTIAVTSMAFWRYSTVTGTVEEVMEVPPLPGRDKSVGIAVNNNGKFIGYSRDLGFGDPFDLVVHDLDTGAATEFTFPATPSDINNLDQVVGGTYVGDLNGSASDIGIPPTTASARLVEITDSGWMVAGVTMPYTDGAGRFVHGAARYDGQWDLLWANSAFDSASGINDGGDVVGLLGISAAIRPALYVADDQQLHLVNDLITPSQPAFFSGVADINNSQQIATAIPAAVLTPLGVMIIPGDLSGDAQVMLDDLCAWLSDPVDLDGDGDIDADDEQWLLDRLAALGLIPEDCNSNGVPDTCDILSGSSADCNEDSIPDDCQSDCDNDGVPDDCESDCNDNGTPDDCDIASGTSDDCNFNGIPDECDGSDTVTALRLYDPPELLIPNDTFTDSILVTDVGDIADVEVTLNLDYRIGDLVVRLSHAGQTVTLIDRPGYPASPSGHSQVGYRITLDDEGTGGPIEDEGFPHGPFEPIESPPSYTSIEALAALDGLPRDGLWTIEVVTLSGAIADPKFTSWGVTVTDQAVPVGVCGDIDGDGDLDGDDMAMFLGCMDGPSVPLPPSCDSVDLDHDGDVDLADSAVFQRFFGD